MWVNSEHTWVQWLLCSICYLLFGLLRTGFPSCRWRECKKITCSWRIWIKEDGSKSWSYSCYGSSVGTLNLSSMFREIPKYSCHHHCHDYMATCFRRHSLHDSVYTLLHTLTHFVYSKITLVSFCLFNSKITATLPKTLLNRKYLSMQHDTN